MLSDVPAKVWIPEIEDEPEEFEEDMLTVDSGWAAEILAAEYAQEYESRYSDSYDTQYQPLEVMVRTKDNLYCIEIRSELTLSYYSTKTTRHPAGEAENT